MVDDQRCVARTSFARKLRVLHEDDEVLGPTSVLTDRARPMLVPNQVRGCVCFVYVRVNEKMRPVGTAFFVRVDDDAHLLVTALHLLSGARELKDRGGDGLLYVRVNTTDGSSEILKIRDEDWATPEQTPLTADVACCFWRYGDDLYDYRTVFTDSWLTDDVARVESVGVGDDLFLTGLFVNHHGKERNLPIVRVGNIAAMPGEPVDTPTGPVEAYLVETRSVGGLSGSPVFINMGTLRYDEDGVDVRQRTGRVWYLLGVMKGHWSSARQAAPGDGGGLSDEYVNMGIAIVTPITKVVPLLSDPKIREPVEAIVEAERAKMLPVDDASDAPNEEFDRFEDLTRKLVQTPKPEKPS